MGTAEGIDVALVSGKIVGVGRTNEVKALAGDGTKVMDLQGKTVTPGFEEEIKDMKVETTMVGGEIVYQRGG